MEKNTRRLLNTENLTVLHEEDVNKLLTESISQDAKVVKQWQDLMGAISGCEIGGRQGAVTGSDSVVDNG